MSLAFNPSLPLCLYGMLQLHLSIFQHFSLLVIMKSFAVKLYNVLIDPPLLSYSIHHDHRHFFVFSLSCVALLGNGRATHLSLSFSLSLSLSLALTPAFCIFQLSVNQASDGNTWCGGIYSSDIR